MFRKIPSHIMTILAACLLFVGLPQAQADTLTLNQVGAGYFDTSYVLGNATLRSDRLFIFDTYSGADSSGALCAVAPAGNCAADLGIDFHQTVENMSLVIAGFNDGPTYFDEITIFGYLDGDQVGQQTVTANGLLDLSSFGLFNSLFFDDESPNGYGVAYMNFSFDSVISAVPLPGALPLFGGALLGVYWLRRRKG